MANFRIEQVLCEEAAAIHDAQIDRHDPHLYRKLNACNSAALCLSGGGIRSAAFALGVIQALATHPRPADSRRLAGAEEQAKESLLAQFHYLSTVSGGGYIGSWLSAWRHHQPFAEIWKQLVRRPLGPDVEAPPVAWLRSYTNYLTPRRGMASGDTWAAVVLWLRNLLLNWLVILPAVCAAVIAVKIVGLASTWTILWSVDVGWRPQWNWGETAVYARMILEILCGVGAPVCLARALAFATRHRPTRRTHGDCGPEPTAVLHGYVAWSLLSAFLLTHFLASDLVGNLLLTCQPGQHWGWSALSFCSEHRLAHALGSSLNQPRYPLGAEVVAGAFLGALTYAIGWACARRWGHDRFDLVMWTISGAFYGAVVGLGLYLYLVTPDQITIGLASSRSMTLQVYFIHVVLGVPWLLGAQLVADMLFAGLSSYETNSDADREWFGRVASWLLVAVVAWLALTFVVFFGSLLRAWVTAFKDNVPSIDDWSTAIVTVSGLVTAIFGKSAVTGRSGSQKGLQPAVFNLVLAIAAGVFVVALLITISYGLDQLLFSGGLMPNDPLVTPQYDWGQRLARLLGALVLSILVGAVASLTININRFSLHAIYRNRLVRAFLGASSGDRHPDHVSGFDPRDNPKMHHLWPGADGRGWRPFHVINIALNAASTRNLAWQERKAEPFTVSPLHCGNRHMGYRTSREFGGSSGISLGTAMAISGAAANPNMGYHSSPAITFLLTMFNVRLGWWLGNPGECGEGSYADEGPALAIVPLVQEALGSTTDDRRYVHLSDGGHFENLGLYEMVRRRCRHILVCDAGCDPNYGLSDLADATRKIEIDLGVKIRFIGLDKLRPRPKDDTEVGPGHPYSAVGEIDYRDADGADDNGIVLYLKAGYHDVESAGVRGYAHAHRSFPHESTVDQWFSESQFESYRALGFEIADGILQGALAHGARANLDGVFAALYGATRHGGPHRHRPAAPRVA